ncbi:MAG: hypothetical protein H5U40_01970 [Polyangiaceae bacterium]|nr:hypothetical protein [Polyangiaceae bacterium]
MSDDEEDHGFSYYVSDEQLVAFARCSVAQRLEWLEEMRAFSIAASTPAVRESWRRLRASKAQRDLEPEEA